MYGRCDENTFSHFGRKLENRVGNMGSGIFVQQAVLAFSCGDMKFVFTYHIIENIGVNTSGVNYNFGFKSFFVFRICVERGNTVTISVFFNCL